MITTPTKPNGNQFEDLVTACMCGLGYFTETRLELQKQSAQILEFDSVATPSDRAFADKLLVEAKSGDWGCGDLFKMDGQMWHVSIKRGRLVYFQPIDGTKEKATSELAADIGKNAKDPDRLACARLPLDENGDPALDFAKAIAPACRPLSDERLFQLVGIAWFGQIAQRLALAQFIQQCKSGSSPWLPHAKAYRSAIAASFFKRSPLVRVDELYDAWKAAPNLAGEFVAERAKAKGMSTDRVWSKVKDSPDLPWVQYVMLLEHKARLGIIKNGLEHLQAPAPATTSAAIVANLRQGRLPGSFQIALQKLKKHPHGLRLPYLLQVFIEVLGGFLYVDNDDDRELLAELSGIPPGDVVDALELIDDVFPTGKGWFFTPKDKIKIMKMVPGFVRGIGCFARRSFYGIDGYAKRYPDFYWLLGYWNDAAYHTLEKELKKVQQSAA